MNEEIKPENMRIHSRADELITCLEGEIAKRDETIARLEPQLNRAIQANYDLREELAACRVAVENCEVFRARIAELERQLNSDKLIKMVTELRTELAALKAQDTVGEVVGWYRLDRPYEMTPYPSVCATWHRLGAPVAPLYAAPVQQVSVPDGFVLAKETVVEMPDGSKELGYTTIGRVGIFNSAEEVFDAIRELDLPLGWVSMTTEQLLPGWMLTASTAAPAADAWIQVSERLPGEDDQVLCWCEDETVAWAEVSSHHNSFFTDMTHELLPVTHWMPLPAAPSANSAQGVV